MPHCVAAIAGSVPHPSGGVCATGYDRGRRVEVALAPVGNGKSLRADAALAFRRMAEAAREDGIELVPLSGFRTFEEQQVLYRAYRAGRAPPAARPGYSNHQMGIAVDIRVGGTRTATYRWLAENAARFGFRRTVPSEPWHWEFRPR